MSKISVVFWTQGGNTESMANAIVEGIKEAGKEAEAVFVSDMNIDELKGEGVFALGLSLIHISEPTRRTPISYAVFCLKKKT